MAKSPSRGRIDVARVVTDWLESCRRKKKISRNTYAVGLVVLDRLRATCPLDPQDAVSIGGEIKGARSALPATLEKYEIPRTYLKETTTRQSSHDGIRLFEALEYGRALAGLPADARDRVLREGIGVLTEGINAWFLRQHLKVQCARTNSPAAWIGSIIAQAKGKSGGVVEQHLVGAKLAERFSGTEVQNHPGHAGDLQTNRQGDFVVGSTVYHVTAAPGEAVIDKCRANVDQGYHPCLVVPSSSVVAARQLASNRDVDEQITIIAIEDFLALNIMEMAEGEQPRFLEILGRIVETYNRRLAEVETDMSLRIEIS
jgi:hypothetical protein